MYDIDVTSDQRLSTMPVAIFASTKFWKNEPSTLNLSFHDVAK